MRTSLDPEAPFKTSLALPPMRRWQPASPPLRITSLIYCSHASCTVQMATCLSRGNVSEVDAPGTQRGSLLLVETMEGLLAQLEGKSVAELGECGGHKCLGGGHKCGGERDSEPIRVGMRNAPACRSYSHSLSAGTLNPPPSPPQATPGSARMQCGQSSPSSPRSCAPTTGT